MYGYRYRRGEVIDISVGQVSFRSKRPPIIRRREQVGDRIRSLRRWRRLSQQRLGEAFEADRRTVAGIENGRIATSVDVALEIADALKVPATWLFSDDWVWPNEGGAQGGEWGDEPPPKRFP